MWSSYENGTSDKVFTNSRALHYIHRPKSLSHLYSVEYCTQYYVRKKQQLNEAMTSKSSIQLLCSGML